MRLAFADCILDAAALTLLRDGEPVDVEPQVFDLIRLLAENPDRVVTRDEIVDRIWGGRAVSEAAISSRIHAARRAVGDDGSAQAVIRTVPRRGLRLVVPVTAEGEVPPPAAPGRPQSAQRQTIRYATSRDGSAVAWAESGEGSPLLFAAGHLTHLELDWQNPLTRRVVDRLGAGRRLIRFDITGTGLSDTRAEASLDDFTDDLEAVADAAGLDRFPIVANVQGAMVAVRFAARHPGRVTRLVLQNGYATGRARRPDAVTGEADPMLWLMKSGWGDPDNGHMRGWISYIMPSARYDDVTAMIRHFAAVCPAPNVPMVRNLIDRFDAAPDLAAVRVPTLVIHSRANALHPLDEARKLARGIPGAELLVVDCGDTWLLPSNPTFETQMTAIEEFLSAAP